MCACVMERRRWSSDTQTLQDSLARFNPTTCRRFRLSQFVKFANIEEDTPSYHRRYDFFVSQFSAMCHSTHEEPETRTR